MTESYEDLDTYSRQCGIKGKSGRTSQGEGRMENILEGLRGLNRQGFGREATSFILELESLGT